MVKFISGVQANTISPLVNTPDASPKSRGHINGVRNGQRSALSNLHGFQLC